MITKLFTVQDAKAEFFMSPWTARTISEAIRSFSHSINDVNSPLNSYPGDYTLFEIGEFDDATGVMTPSAPKSLGNGLEFKRSWPPLTQDAVEIQK